MSDFPGGSAGKESACNAGYPGLIPGSGRSAGEGIGYPFQYSWASLVAQLVKNLPAMWETWVWKIPLRREQLPTPVFWSGETNTFLANIGFQTQASWLSLLAEGSLLIPPPVNSTSQPG